MARILSMLAALALATSQACAAQNEAFAVGISNYEIVETLVNPAIDATKIADKLAESGYSDTRIIDGGTGKSELDDLVEALAKSRTPTSKNNSVYLGKTAAANCDPGTSGNAFPFGCELIKKLTALSGGRLRCIRSSGTDHKSWRGGKNAKDITFKYWLSTHTCVSRRRIKAGPTDYD